MRTGYKQTDVGVIPEEWEILQIRDVCRLVNGRGFKPHEWQTSGLPIIRIQNLNGSDDFNFYSGQYHPKILIEHGQLLFAWSGSRGTSFGPHVWNGGRALLNYHTWKVVVNESNVTPDFLLYALRQLTSYIEDMAHGASALVHTQKWQMEKLPIVVPASHSEQHAIATALSDVDALLAALDRLIAKKRDLKQAAMQQLLTGQTRLPGFTGKWETKRVLDLGDVVTGGTPRTDVAIFWGDEYPWITPTDISAHRDMFTSERTITRKGLDSIRALPPNTVLVTCIASIGKNAILRTAGACNQQINAVTPNKNNSAEFLYYVFEASKQYLQANAGTTATSIISKATFAQLTFTVPPHPEQTAIATVLSDMDLELAALEQRRDKTRALKQGMMQELLTGRTRLV